MPGPAVPGEVCGQVLELEPGGGEHLAGAGADAGERFGGVCVADGGPAAVGVLVEGPAVEVGVELGEGVPGGQDPFAVAQVAVEAPQRGAAVRGRDGKFLSVQRRAAGWAVRAFTGAGAGFV
ncbi:hypothetical protein GCM10010415_20030 [Streptomyces atrovirens]